MSKATTKGTKNTKITKIKKVIERVRLAGARSAPPPKAVRAATRLAKQAAVDQVRLVSPVSLLREAKSNAQALASFVFFVAFVVCM